MQWEVIIGLLLGVNNFGAKSGKIPDNLEFIDNPKYGNGPGPGQRRYVAVWNWMALLLTYFLGLLERACIISINLPVIQCLVPGEWFWRG